MKRCSKCGRELSLSEFGKRSASKDGLQCWCKACAAKYHQKYQQSPEGRASSARYSAKNYRSEKGKETKTRYNQTHKIERAERAAARYQTIKGFLYQCFRNLDQRCNNFKDRDYKYYGGRGIKNLFRSFGDFYHHVTVDLDLTYNDIKGLQIDRIENDGHYEPWNIQFVTAKMNSNNRRKKRSNEQLRMSNDQDQD